jgi:hypothetical protein
MWRASAIPSIRGIQGEIVVPVVEKASPIMGYMRRATMREDDERVQERFSSTLAICASIIAAVRLARNEHIGSASPRVLSVVADSVMLAKSILKRVLQRQ